jgi:hypothetical protein
MRVLVASLGVISLVSACGGGSSPTIPTMPPQPTAGAFTASVAPNPIIAQDCTPAKCGNEGYQFFFDSTVTVTESAGRGGNVDFINVTMRNDTTGIELKTYNFTANDVIKYAGANHVNGMGKLTIPNSGLIYRLALRRAAGNSHLCHPGHR